MISNFIERRTQFFDLLALIALSAAVIFPAIGQNTHLASREIHHAEIIREMVESGDYLIPKLFGKTYCDKPPVMHAAAAFITRMVGEPSIAITRIPSAIAGILGVLATYCVGLLLLDRLSALIGAVALLGMPGYSLMASRARPDMILCASILFSCLCLGLGMRKQDRLPRMFYFVLAGLFAGVGAITKGPYGVLVPIFFIVFVPFRNHDFTRPRFGWTGFCLGILTAIAIWATPAYLRDGGEYLRGVLFQPDLDVREGGGSGKSFFYYIQHGLLLTLPLSLFLPLAIIDLRRRGYSALLAIAGAIFIVITCIPKKRQHYLLPIDPFLALGITASIVRHSVTSHIIRRTAWILIPISVIAMPFYFIIIQPIVQPYKNSQIFFAKEVFKAIETNPRIYTVTSIDEVLAWVERRYEGIYKLDRQDPSVDMILRKAEAGSYLVISEQDLASFFKGKEPLPCELILSCKVDHEKMMLFRLKGKTSELPRE